MPALRLSVLLLISTLIFFFQSEAQELTTIKMSKFGGGVGAPTKEKKLKEAAEIHLRLGQIQRYCELMVELGEVVCYSRKSSVSNIAAHTGRSNSM